MIARPPKMRRHHPFSACVGRPLRHVWETPSETPPAYFPSSRRSNCEVSLFLIHSHCSFCKKKLSSMPVVNMMHCNAAFHEAISQPQPFIVGFFRSCLGDVVHVEWNG